MGMWAGWLLLVAWVVSGAVQTVWAGSESQAHGFRFEEWIRQTFFDGYQPDHYTQPWDIPGWANRHYGGVPVNPKMVKYGSPIDLGEARRQFEVAHQDESFMLIVAYWEQVTPRRKKVVNIQAVEVSPAQYRALWGHITAEDLQRVERVIRDRRLSVREARERAHQLLRKAPFAEAPIKIHPKLDATQRRLQCSLSFTRFFQFLAPKGEAGRHSQPRLFGVEVPEFEDSPPRARRTTTKGRQALLPGQEVKGENWPSRSRTERRVRRVGTAVQLEWRDDVC